MTFRTFFLFAFAGQLFGQLESNTLTITASRAPSAEADQAIFNVTVDAIPSKGLDDILAALQTLGITAANLSSLDRLTDGTLEWYFTLPVLFAKVQSTANSVAALQQTIAKSNSGLNLSFSIDGSQASPALMQSQSCPVTDLVSGARSQAQKLADAAGFSVGPILSIDASSANIISTLGFYSVTALSSFVLYYSAPAPSCAITVKFQLLRYE